MTDPSPPYGWSADSGVTLQAKLKEDLKYALRAHQNTLKDAIRQVMSEYFRLTVPVVLEGGKKSTRPKTADEITDNDIIGIIQGLIKSEHVVLEAKKEAASEYLRILERYLPRQASREEIAAWIEAHVDFSRYKNRMQAMGDIMKHFGRSADGKLVNQILKEEG